MRDPVSSPRHVEWSLPISSTPLSCPLHGKDYAIELGGKAFDSDDPARAYSTFTHHSSLPPTGYRVVRQYGIGLKRVDFPPEHT